MRSKIRLCVAFFAAVLAAGGCGGTEQAVSYETAGEDITTIKFFGNKYEPENVTVIEEIISDFMDDNPDIRVSYESLKGSEYYEALQKRIEAGKGDDIFMVNHDVLLALVSQGQLTDLSVISSVSNYTDAMYSQMNEDGKIYWLPTTVSVFGLYCNEDLLKKHGQKIPENLTEWREACAYFAAQGITPIIANNDISLKTLAIGKGFHSVYGQSQQRQVFERLNRGQEQLSTYLKQGFTLVDEFIDKGYVNAGDALNTNKTSDDLKEFVRGKSPFMLTGAWAAGRVAGMHPDFSFEVVPYPVLEDGSLEVINADTRLSVNAAGDHVDEAIKFVEYFIRPENIKRFVDQQSSLSPLKGGGHSSQREIQPLIECYQSGSTVIGTDGLLELPIWELTAEASRKLLAGSSLDETMRWMDEACVNRREMS